MLIYSTALKDSHYSCCRIFSVCDPQLSGCILFAPPDARAIFLHNDLLCNDMCSVTAGSVTNWGTQTEKIPAAICLVQMGNFYTGN